MFNRLIEILLNLPRGFLSREGSFALTFNPRWPWNDAIGATPWNLLLIVAAVALVTYVYRREGRAKGIRIALAAVRLALIGFVILLLNRPNISLTQSRIEPSVLAILVDDSLSMRIPDIGAENGTGIPRLQAVENLLSDQDAELVKTLAKTHQLHFYRFDSDAAAVSTSTTQPSPTFEATGQQTNVPQSVETVLRDLQGQRLAGVVVLTDGRDQPRQSVAAAIDAVKDYGAPIYPIPVGSEKPLRNIELQQVSAQDAVFAKDITNIKATVKVTGQPTGPVVVRLKDKATGRVMTSPDGKPVEQSVTPNGDQPTEVELLYTPTEPGNEDLIVEAEPQQGEIDLEDNARPLQLAVLDSQITVLYIDGYPRWDYRYIKTEMMRDKTIGLSCWLLSADANFLQEGNKPITRLPETADELLAYDVVLIGDADPREFTDAQLQLLTDFVARRGGGFGMVAGPRFSPVAWKGTPIEQILPVDISRVQPEEWGTNESTIAEGFRPVVTREGSEASLFRFFPDKATNEQYLKQSWQPIYWYAKGIVAKPGVGEVLAEHPNDAGPDGRKAPILVAGRYGAGRTMFLGTDESWRWRYYTGESVFDTYWVQQLRFLARSRKLGQRKITLVSQKPVYDLGQQVQLILRVIDPQLQTQLPDQIRVKVLGTDGQVIREEALQKQTDGSTYLASFAADRLGTFSVRLPSVASGVDEITVPMSVQVPKLELSQPEVDRPALSRLAKETGGRVIEFADAATELPKIPSAQRLIPLISQQPLWNAPLAMAIFVFLLTLEWIVRKIVGMV